MASFTIITVLDGDCSRKEVNVCDGQGAVRCALESLRDHLLRNRETTMASALVCEGRIDPGRQDWIGAWLWEADKGFAWSQDDVCESSD